MAMFSVSVRAKKEDLNPHHGLEFLDVAYC